METTQRLPNRPPPLNPEEHAELRKAIDAATRLYPGPVGELLALELDRWNKFGYRFGGSSLIGQLTRFLLAQWDAREQQQGAL